MCEEYPRTICTPCGHKYGKRVSHSTVATFYPGICGVCGNMCSVTEPRDFGHLKPGWEKEPKKDVRITLTLDPGSLEALYDALFMVRCMFNGQIRRPLESVLPLSGSDMLSNEFIRNLDNLVTTVSNLMQRDEGPEFFMRGAFPKPDDPRIHPDTATIAAIHDIIASAYHGDAATNGDLKIEVRRTHRREEDM